MKRLLWLPVFLASGIQAMENNHTANTGAFVPLIRRPEPKQSSNPRSILPQVAQEDLIEIKPILFFDLAVLITSSSELKGFNIAYNQTAVLLKRVLEEKNRMLAEHDHANCPDRLKLQQEHKELSAQYYGLPALYQQKMLHMTAKFQDAAARVAAKKRAAAICSSNGAFYIDPAYNVTKEMFDQLEADYEVLVRAESNSLQQQER